MKGDRFHRGAADYARRVPEQPSSGHAFLIVTEGKKTEPHYFERLRAMLRLRSVDVEIVHPEGTDPISLTRYAIGRKVERERLGRHGIGVRYDEIWVVFDLEGMHDPRREQAKSAMNMKEARSIRFAQSDPSFEYWLILHFENTHAPLSDSKDAENRLRRRQNWPDYEKACIPPESVIEKIPCAIRNTKQCRAFHETAGGDGNPFTDVDFLVEELNSATREHLRIPGV